MTASTTTAADVVQHIDPSTLLVDVNLRTDNRLDKDFLASVRDLGVLQPIVAVRTADGALRVRYGHRRTLAAVEAGRTTVPVVIAGDEGTDQADTIERLVTQYAENEHRTGLSTGERLATVEQLSLLGVTPAQITKRIRMARADVDAALTIATSDVAHTVATSHDLDLTQAAVVAEFEDDAEVVSALIEAAARGQFNHVAQRSRDQRARAQQRAAFIQALQEAGVAMADEVACPGVLAVSLDMLSDQDGQPITVDAHHECPGHAARIYDHHGWIDPSTGFPPDHDNPSEDDGDSDDPEDDGYLDADEDEDAREAEGLVWGVYPIARYVCVDPTTHGHQSRWGASPSEAAPLKAADMSPEDRAAANAKRQDVIQSNKAWRSAETVRRDWLKTFCSRKTAPKGSAALIATTSAKYHHSLARSEANTLAADLLGCEAATYGRSNPIVDLITQASEARAQVIALTLALSAHEASTHLGSWRSVSSGTRLYLEFLAANGYALCDVERRACGQDPLPEIK